jgi:DNA-binding transcriptional MerR regulator
MLTSGAFLGVLSVGPSAVSSVASCVVLFAALIVLSLLLAKLSTFLACQPKLWGSHAVKAHFKKEDTMEQQMLKSGEFARICDTTKETLRHYHNIGLLSPAHIADNGYRYYSDKQLIEFFFIAGLQSAGCSLDEIREYLTKPSSAEMRAMLREKLAVIADKKRDLVRQETLLRDSLAFFDRQDNATASPEFRVEECKTEYFLEKPIHAHSYYDYDVIEALKEHQLYCVDHGFGEVLQGTVRVSREDFLRSDCDFSTGYYRDWFLCFKIARRARLRRLHVKPPGSYLKLLRGIKIEDALEPESRAAFYEAYSDLRTYAADNGYQIAGDLYETDASVYTGSLKDTAFTELAVRVETQKK